MAPTRSLPVQFIIRPLTRRPIPTAPRRIPYLHSHTRAPPPLLSPRRHHHHHPYSTSTSEPPPPRPYTFEEIRSLTANPSPSRIIIDVREPAEVQQSGRIPGARSMPLTSNPDAFYLSDGEFFDRFGFEKPRAVVGGGSSSSSSSREESPYSAKAKEREAGSGLGAAGKEDDDDGAEVDGGGKAGGEGEGNGGEEVIFYCKAGVRSRAAARMAREWVGVKAGDMKGGWMEWEGRGGEVER